MGLRGAFSTIKTLGFPIFSPGLPKRIVAAQGGPGADQEEERLWNDDSDSKGGDGVASGCITCESMDEPTIVAWDIMGPLKTLSAFGAHKYTPRIEMHAAVRKGMQVDLPHKAYAPSDLYTAFAGKVMNALARLPPGSVLVLIADKGDLVPSIKRREQEKRAAHSDTPPYDIPGMLSNEATDATKSGLLPPCVSIDDAGMVLGNRQAGGAARMEDEGGEFGDDDGGDDGGIGALLGADSTYEKHFIVSSRIMSTRALRPVWYRYLRRKLSEDLALNSQLKAGNKTLVVDMTSDVTAVLRDGKTLWSQGLVAPAGEAEVAAVLWGLRFAQTHHCEIHSEDTDVVVLSLLHAHAFRKSLTFVAHRKLRGQAKRTEDAMYSTMVARDAASGLHRRQWSLAEVCLALVCNGTDYVERGDFIKGATVKSLVHASRQWAKKHTRRDAAWSESAEGGDDLAPHRKIACDISDALASFGRFCELVAGFYIWTLKKPRADVWGPSAFDGSLEGEGPATLERAREIMDAKARCRLAIPSKEMLRIAHACVCANWSYWCTLDEEADKQSTFSSPRDLVAACEHRPLPRTQEPSSLLTSFAGEAKETPQMPDSPGSPDSPRFLTDSQVQAALTPSLAPFSPFVRTGKCCCGLDRCTAKPFSLFQSIGAVREAFLRQSGVVGGSWQRARTNPIQPRKMTRH